MRRVRALLLAAPVLLAALPAPARAEEPVRFLATAMRGNLVETVVTGRVARSRPVTDAPAGSALYTGQVNGGTATVTIARENGTADVGVVDLRTGTLRQLTNDGRSGRLLTSRDGKVRFVQRIDATDGHFVSVVRLDGRRARTLVGLPPKKRDVVLSGAALSPDARTLYVARTHATAPAQLLAVDTVTGATRQLSHASLKWVHDLALSPDGRTLAVSYLGEDQRSRVRLVPVSGDTATELAAPEGMPVTATSFSADGSTVVLATDAVAMTDLASLPGLRFGDVTTGVVTPLLYADTAELLRPVALP